MANILVSVIGNDVHAVANKVIVKLLQEEGHEVWNIGVAAKPKEIVDAIIEFSPNLVLIGSLNGEINFWAKNFKTAFDKLGFFDIKIFIGGNIGYGDLEQKNKKYLTKLGFHAVFGPRDDIETLLASIKMEF